MEAFDIRELKFSYPGTERHAVGGITISVPQGQFVTVCGKSGCGKSTLLRLLKPAIAPCGDRSGEILFFGERPEEMDPRRQSCELGFVQQDPENQIVTDKVWHELAFGLESLGCKTEEIRARVSEMASFFGIQNWFHKSVTELSGGQKQMLNLASVMVMQPSAILLDEPTSRLDPIAASDFLAVIKKINSELGVTVIMAEHRLEEALPMSDRVLVMESGRIIADGTPSRVGQLLKESGNDMFISMPVPMRVYAAVENGLGCPVTVREGRGWLEEISAEKGLRRIEPPEPAKADGREAVGLENVWFRYEKSGSDVLRGLSLSVKKGEIYAVLGGNGTGKTTALAVAAGLKKPYRGSVRISDGRIGMLPQDPKTVFLKKTVRSDLEDAFSFGGAMSVGEAASLCDIGDVLDMHPFDLSGGEQQRAALAKLLLTGADILLLDEPTKGMDGYFKLRLAEILKRLALGGATIIIVSHDIEFCAENANRCGLFFDGKITSEGPPREFFSGKSFYTTAADRMARGIIPNAVMTNDIIFACGGTIPQRPVLPPPGGESAKRPDTGGKKSEKGRFSLKRAVISFAFLALFVLTWVFLCGLWSGWRDDAVRVVMVMEAALCLIFALPKGRSSGCIQGSGSGGKKLTRRTAASLVIIAAAVPLTIWAGMALLGDRKYYFVSLLIILEVMLPFAMVFEGRSPQAREIVLVAVMSAIVVAGRTAFIAVPQFKPMVALVIIAGISMGAETGFLVGAVSAFVSNMFFGQGPWTPWQMLAVGVIGFLAGLLFSRGWLKGSRTALCIFGLISTVIIYGGIMNPASVLIYQSHPNLGMFVAAYATGLPYDLIHASATVFFLWVLAAPMAEKLQRVQVKYGLLRTA